MSYRPFEVDGELDDLLGHHLNAVVGQHGSQPLTEGALVLGVDGCLIVFQTDPEFGCADTRAHAVGGLESLATVAHRIFAHFVLETF